MSKKIHPKILELRNKVGYSPIYEFKANRKKYDAVDTKYRAPSTEENKREIKQYFCIWGVPDDYGTQPMKGCFTKSLNERGPKTSATNKIVVLNQHMQRSPLCIPKELYEDEIGLFGVYTPDEGIQENDDLVIRVKNRTINGGSYGFNYVWDKMEYDDKTDVIHMFETELFEVSPVTIASQGGTFVVRNKQGRLEDKMLELETEELLRKIPRQHQLEIRSLISRHIALAESQPNEQSKKSLKTKASRSSGKIDYEYLIENLND